MAPLTPAVGHVVREWLPRSATFVHTLVRHQRRVRPAIFAARTGVAAAEFPVEDLVDLRLGARRRPPARLLDGVRARLAGHATTFDHRLVQAARSRDVIALHGHFGPAAVDALPAARALGFPLVATFYGFDLAFGERAARVRAGYDTLFAEASGFVVEGPAMARTLAAIGAPEDRIRVVPIGFDLDLFPFTPRTPTRPLIVLQAARLIPKKGVDVSLRAFAAARPKLGEAELWILGDGPLRSGLERLAAELGIAARVRFLGATSYADYREAVSRAHVCLQPSRVAPDGDTEGGAPTVIIEMQAAGMPVVATRHADIPSVMPAGAELPEEEDVDGVAAALVALAQAPPEEWARRTRRARAFVEREHDARRTAALVEDVYFSAISAPPVFGRPGTAPEGTPTAT